MDIISKYSSYIRRTIFELACSSALMHRTNCNEGASLLHELLHNYDDSERAITEACHVLNNNVKFNEKLKLYNVYSDTDVSTEIFLLFIDIIGINGIKNVCDEDRDTFYFKFCVMLDDIVLEQRYNLK